MATDQERYPQQSRWVNFLRSQFPVAKFAVLKNSDGTVGVGVSLPEEADTPELRQQIRDALDAYEPGASRFISFLFHTIGFHMMPG